MAGFIVAVVIGSFVLAIIIGIGKAVNEAMFDPSKVTLPYNMKIIRRDEHGKPHFANITFHKNEMKVDFNTIKYSDITSARVSRDEYVKRAPTNYYLSVKARTCKTYSLKIDSKNSSEWFGNYTNVVGYDNVVKMIEYMKGRHYE